MDQSQREAYNAYMRKYMLARHNKRRAEAIEILGGKCAICGTVENLEIDHVNWREKSFDLGNLWSVAKARYFEELKKCQALCHEHHKEKTRADLAERIRERGGSNQYGPYGPTGR